jgi:signal transduction histidine kinase
MVSIGEPDGRSYEGRYEPSGRPYFDAEFAPDFIDSIKRIAGSAARLVEAQYAILSASNRDEGCFLLISSGFSNDLDKVEHSGLADITERLRATHEVLRIPDLAEYRLAEGFPFRRTALTSLIGVPIRVDDQIFSQLYLGNKKGGAAFTAADEETAVALAASAGAAMENAHLFVQERRRHRWLESALETTRLLLGQVDRDTALQLVAERLREVSRADGTAIVLVSPESSEGVVIFAAADGYGGENLINTPVPMQGLTARVISTGQRIISENVTGEQGYDPPPEVLDLQANLGSGMYIPLTVAGKVLGVLVVGWRRGAPGDHISAQEVELVEMFAGQAALALQQAQARQLVLEDRDRIANDLRDVAVDRLFAIGSRLHGTTGLVARTEVERRMNDAIDELDETSQQIRSAIFALRHDDSNVQRTASSQVLDEIDAAKATLGFTPRLVVHGSVDRYLPPHVQRELVRAVRETLTNAASHTGPTRVEVEVRVGTDELSLTVTDDGSLSEREPFHGALTQLRARAKRLGGDCAVRAGEHRGTLVEWHLPLTV